MTKFILSWFETFYIKNIQERKNQKNSKNEKRRKNKQETETRHKTQETLSIVYMYIFVKIALISKYPTKFGPQFS